MYPTKSPPTQPDQSKSLAEQGTRRTTCHFCNEIYEVGSGELQKLINELAAA